MMRCVAPVVYSPEYECDIGRHVFPTQKFRLVRDALIATGVLDGRDVIVPAAPPRADLLLVHTPEYLDDLEHLRWTPRTRMSELPHCRDRARLPTGGGRTTRAAAGR
jgi:acetoin utilization deacetylase AcuC-like enzyme